MRGQYCGGWGDGKGFPCPRSIMVSKRGLRIREGEREIGAIPLIAYGNTGVVDAICGIACPVCDLGHGGDADDAFDG